MTAASTSPKTAASAGSISPICPLCSSTAWRWITPCLLQHLRRQPGQRHSRRPVAHDQGRRHPQQRMGQLRRRRWVSTSRRSRQSEHHLFHVAERRPYPNGKRRHGQEHWHQAQDWRRALELGLSIYHQPAFRQTALLCRQPLVPQRRPGRQLDCYQPRPDTPTGSRQATGDGETWGPDAVTRNLFTTALSVGSALAESPVKDGLLYFGSDDGLVQVTEDGGKNWRKIDSFPGVPEMTYVSSLCASKHDAGTVYAAFNNLQRGDFKPYLLKSTDRGKTWTSIVSNLPQNHQVWCVVEDHVNKDLLFVGTEFGLFCTVDGGKNWVQLKGGLPVVAFRDLEIQRRENDLVCGNLWPRLLRFRRLHSPSASEQSSPGQGGGVVPRSQGVSF